jgi:hypothetical protein
LKGSVAGGLERVCAAPLDAFPHASYVLVRPLFSWYRIHRVAMMADLRREDRR